MTLIHGIIYGVAALWLAAVIFSKDKLEAFVVTTWFVAFGLFLGTWLSHRHPIVRTTTQRVMTLPGTSYDLVPDPIQRENLEPRLTSSPLEVSGSGVLLRVRVIAPDDTLT